MYGSTSELMAAASSDFVEKASGGHSVKRRGLLSRQKSSLTFDMGAKKIEQVYYNFSKLIWEKMQTDYLLTSKNVHNSSFWVKISL